MSKCWPLQLPVVAKAVLISLADNANDEGYCWPSLATICTRTCYGRSAVSEAISWLADNGYLTILRSIGGVNRYVVRPDPSASRMGVEGKDLQDPVRQPDYPRPPRGPDPSASRTLTVKNHQEPQEDVRKRTDSPRPEKRKAGKVSFETFRELCQADGEGPLPEDDPIFTYAEEIGLPAEFVSVVAWEWFRGARSGAKQAGKRGWRQHFRDAVRGAWGGLWRQDGDGQWVLTTAGKQAQAAAEARRAAA